METAAMILILLIIGVEGFWVVKKAEPFIDACCRQDYLPKDTEENETDAE